MMFQSHRKKTRKFSGKGRKSMVISSFHTGDGANLQRATRASVMVQKQEKEMNGA